MCLGTWHAAGTLKEENVIPRNLGRPAMLDGLLMIPFDFALCLHVVDESAC